MRLAIIGDRGIPARYSGFSTLVEQLAVRLVRDHGFDVSVYCRNHYYDNRPPEWNGVKCIYLPAPGGKSFESIVHSNLAIADAAVRGFDLCFVVDPGNAPFALPLKARGMPTVFHTDGLGWKRRKWSALQRKYYRWSEKVCARLATWLVTDSRAIQDYYEREYGAQSSFIPYSGEVGDDPDSAILDKLGLEPDGFYLAVARMEPENNLDLIIRDYRKSRTQAPLVVVGGTPYPTEYSRSVMAEADERVRLVGGVYDSAALNALYRRCRAYFHGHEVGGTNPSLLRAMHWGAPCVAIDVPFHREVLGPDALFFGGSGGDLGSIIDRIDGDSRLRQQLGRNAKRRSDSLYRWDAVAQGYASLFEAVAAHPSRKEASKVLAGTEVYRPEEFAEAEVPRAAAR